MPFYVIMTTRKNIFKEEEMSKFIADKSFFELFPEAKLGVILVKNM